MICLVVPCMVGQMRLHQRSNIAYISTAPLNSIFWECLGVSMAGTRAAYRAAQLGALVSGPSSIGSPLRLCPSWLSTGATAPSPNVLGSRRDNAFGTWNKGRSFHTTSGNLCLLFVTCPRCIASLLLIWCLFQSQLLPRRICMSYLV